MMMVRLLQSGLIRMIAAAACLSFLPPAPNTASQPDTTALIQRVDRAVMARVDGIESYTVTEHYAVFRNLDEAHPVAEMTVKTEYKRESGKSYTILSQTGSQVMRKFVLGSILDNEKQINQPGVRE